MLQKASFLRLDHEYYAEVTAGRVASSGSTALAALVWGNQLVGRPGRHHEAKLSVNPFCRNPEGCSRPCCCPYDVLVPKGLSWTDGSGPVAPLLQLVANAGDSRAVLCRGGKAMTLSTDHKPLLPAEQARIIDAGGAVCLEGRLNGELTVARSIGGELLQSSSWQHPTLLNASSPQRGRPSCSEPGAL